MKKRRRKKLLQKALSSMHHRLGWTEWHYVLTHPLLSNPSRRGDLRPFDEVKANTFPYPRPKRWWS